MARLTKRGRVWYGHVYVDGHRIQRSTRCTDRRAAESVVHQWERAAADPSHHATSTALVRDALMLVLDRARARAEAGLASLETLAYDSRKAGHLSRLLEPRGEPMHLDRLTADHVDRYIAQRQIEGASVATVAKELGVLRLSLKLARRAGIFKGNHEELLPVGLGSGYVPRRRWLTEHEVEALLGELAPDRAARVAWLIATGGRWGESERALRADITTRAVHIRGTKTAGSLRDVPLTLPAQQRLATYASAHAEGTASMFRPWGNVRRDLHAACERARIEPCSPNDFRRTLSHWMRLAGIPSELLALVLGHTTTRLVHGVYGHLDGEALGAALAASLTASPVHHSPRPDRTYRTGRTVSALSEVPESLGFPVPRDGIEPPTRGFSIPLPRAASKRKVETKPGGTEPTASPVQQRSRRGAA